MALIPYADYENCGCTGRELLCDDNTCALFVFSSEMNQLTLQSSAQAQLDVAMC